MAKKLLLKVVGENPLDADPPLFANFLGLSHAGAEVQFEFVFLDLNQIAIMAAEQEKQTSTEEHQVQGRTVAKIVVPAASFLQLKPHLTNLFTRLEGLVDEQKETEERKNA